MTDTTQSQENFNLGKTLIRLQNPFMKWMLKSPLHVFVSKWYMLISVTGRKSGNVYTTPVQYKQVDNKLYVISSKKYQWWRNLKGGADVTLRLRGKTLSGQATVSQASGDIEEAYKLLYPGLKQATRDKFLPEGVVIEVEI